MAVYLPGGLGAGMGGSSSGAISSGFSQLGQGVRRGVAMGEDIASNEAARRKKEIAIEDARIAALGAGGGAPPGSIGDLGVASRAQFDATGEEIRAQQALLDADVQRARRIREQQEEQQARALFDSTLRAGGFSVPRPPGRRLRVSRPMMENAGTQLRNPYPEDQTLFDQAGAAIERLQNAPRIGTRRDEGLAQTALQEDEALNEEIRLLRNNQDLNVDTLTPNEAGGFEGPPTIEDLVRRHAEEKARLNPAAEFGLPHGYSGSPQDFARYLSRNTNLPLADRQQAEQRYAAWHDTGVREIATQHAAAEQQRAAALQAQQEQEAAVLERALLEMGVPPGMAQAALTNPEFLKVALRPRPQDPVRSAAQRREDRAAEKAAAKEAADREVYYEGGASDRTRRIASAIGSDPEVLQAQGAVAAAEATFDAAAEAEEAEAARLAQIRDEGLRLEASVKEAKERVDESRAFYESVQKRGWESATSTEGLKDTIQEIDRMPEGFANSAMIKASLDHLRVRLAAAEDEYQTLKERSAPSIEAASRRQRYGDQSGPLGDARRAAEEGLARATSTLDSVRRLKSESITGRVEAEDRARAQRMAAGGVSRPSPAPPLPIPNSEYAIAYLEASGYGPDNRPPNEKIEKSIKHAADVLANRLSNTGTMPPATDEQGERWGIGPSPVERGLPPLTAAERWTKADDPGWTRYRAEDGSVMWKSPKGKPVTPAALEQGYVEMFGR